MFDQKTPYSKGEKAAELASGIVTFGAVGGGCVVLTAIGAANIGLKVTLNTAAIGTVFESKRKTYYKTLRELGAEFI